jgi:putative inorganic carbon (HCO3(-)) transporter
MANQFASAPSRAAMRLLELGLLAATPLLIYRGFSEQFTTIKLVLTEGIVAAAAALVALGLIWRWVRWPRDFRLGAPLGLLMLSVLISCLASPFPKFSIVEAQYFLCGPLWLVGLVVWGGGDARIRRLSVLATFAGAAMAAITLLQWAGYDPLVFGGYRVDWGRMRDSMQLYSTLGNPNFVAGYLIGTIFLALAFAAVSKTVAGKFAGAASAVIMFATILGTRSRGAWLALAAGFLVARVVGRPKAQTSISPDRVESGAKLGLGVFPPLFLALLPGIIGQAGALVARLEGRMFLWRAGWPMFQEQPLFGGGWAMFQLRFPELQAQYLAERPELIRYWTHTSQIHNDPLQILLEAGALGFVAFGWLLWRYAGELQDDRSTRTATEQVWLGASAGGTTAILLNSLINFQLAVPPTLILLFTLLAFPSLLKSASYDSSRHAVADTSSNRWLGQQIMATLGVALITSLLAAGIWTRAAGDRALALGVEQERIGQFARAEGHFRNGLHRSPDDGRLHYGLARALFVQGRYPEALTHVLRAEPTVADAHLEVLRARILDQMGASSAALDAYRHALWLDPRLKSVPADIRRLTSGVDETDP